MTYKYNNGLCPAGRRPRLWLTTPDQSGAVMFQGENIPDIAIIVTSVHEKCGRWSNTTYGLELAPGVRPLYLLSPMHGRWGDGLASWGEVIEKLCVPVDLARDIIRAEYPSTADRLDQVEKFALEQEAAGVETETVVVSFGAPTRRQRDEGFWESPKEATASDGSLVRVEPGPEPFGWDRPEILEAPEGSKILDSVHRPGMGGGYYSVSVLVPLIEEGPQ
jgi:hypothetical protein